MKKENITFNIGDVLVYDGIVTTPVNKELYEKKEIKVLFYIEKMGQYYESWEEKDSLRITKIYLKSLTDGFSDHSKSKAQLIQDIDVRGIIHLPVII